MDISAWVQSLTRETILNPSETSVLNKAMLYGRHRPTVGIGRHTPSRCVIIRLIPIGYSCKHSFLRRNSQLLLGVRALPMYAPFQLALVQEAPLRHPHALARGAAKVCNIPEAGRTASRRRQDVFPFLECLQLSLRHQGFLCNLHKSMYLFKSHRRVWGTEETD